MPQQCTIDRIKEVLTELQSLLDDKNEQGPNNKPVEEKRPSNNEQEPVESRRPSKNEQEPVEKKRSSSLFGWVTGSVKKRFKGKKETSNHGSDSGGGSQGGSRQSRLNMVKEEVDADLEKLRLQSDIHQMKAAFENLTHFQSTISKSLETDVPSNKLKVILEKTQFGKSRARDLKDIRRKVLNLKGQIPSLLKKQSSIGLSITDSQTTEENGQMSEIVETGSDISVPGLHVSIDFKETLAFEEVMEKFEALAFKKMLCLLSFAVFPENKEVKRTMLMYWWIGEGFIGDEDPENEKDPENEVTKILDEFSRKGLLEPVEDETKLKSSGYKMEPHVHSAVIYLARRMELFNLYSSGKLMMQKSERENVCLVKGSSLQPKTSIKEPRNLKSIFNSSERYPDFTFKWFRQLESLKVLYLGRWERTAKRHIEVESTDFLKDMKSLKSLRLASFQGISRIENLKDLVCSLPKLVILDLRACYNLEALPDDIGSLESLIYLDVSECYMLDRMPAGISGLRKLQVLKGFVISQSDDEKSCVKKLEDLRKLSITVNKYNFKVEYFMESLSGLKQLKSLKIAWGARFPDEDKKVEEIELTDESMDNEETTNQEKEKQREEDQAHKKGQTSQEKEGDGVGSKNEQGKKPDEVKAESLKSDKAVEGEKKISPSAEPTEKIQKRPEEKGESKVDGDGDKGKADIEEGKKQDEVEAEKSKSDNGVGEVVKAGPSREPDDKSKAENEANGDKGKKQDEVEAEKSKSDNGVEGVKKASPSREPTEMKPDDKSKMEREADGDKGKKEDEVEAEKSKPGNGVEGVKKASPSQEPTEMKPDDKSNAEMEATGDKGKKQDEVEAEKSKSGNGVEGVKKASPSREPTEMKPDDKSKVEKEANGDKGKKEDEVDAEKSKSDNGVEGVKKASPSQEPTEMKPDDKSKMEKEANGDKGKKEDEVDAEKSKSDNGVEGVKKASPSREPTEMKPDDKIKAEKEANGDKGKKQDEVEAEKSKPDNGVEGVKKASPSQEPTDMKPDDKSKMEKEANGDKGTKQDEVDAEKLNSDNGVEGVKKTSPSSESTNTIENKPDGEKEKANLEEGKKRDEVKAESSKPDKLIEGDEKTSPSKESEDTVKSKPDDHKENSKVQEKGDGEKIKAALKKPDGGEAKTQKSDKNKLSHKVSSSEEPRAPVQKKLDDMEKQNHETASTSRSKKSATMECGSRLARLFTIKRHETKKAGKEGKEDSGTDTSKLPPSLKKLELECFPYEEPPIWLNPKTLEKLEKLSIKGGKLRRFSDEPKTAENKCGVQILRLKYLHEFKAEWKYLHTLFPHLKLLEKYKCPEVAFCPTDGNGVWRLEP